MFLQAGLIVLSLTAIAQGGRRILGGHDAPNHKFPYQVSFRDKRGHFCGGSILNKRWILSAAHCVADLDTNSYTISAGTNFLNESGTVYEPESNVIPKEYKNFYHYDIALVRLKKDVVFTDFVKAIRLPTKDLQDYRRTAIFAGWGVTEYMGHRPNALQEISLNLLPYGECAKTNWGINKRHMCTLNKRGQGACNADSGGPLVVDDVQVGIASYTRTPCGDHPEVWTRVFPYRDWVLKSMQLYGTN